MRLKPGDDFTTEFRLIELLGRGGGGDVWLAEQRTTGRRRALKIMSDVIVRDPTAKRRFEIEARVGSLFSSPHLVDIVDAGVDPGTGRPWLLMEHLHGETLEQRVTRDGALSPGESREILAQLASVLSQAHKAGVVHRDVKPANVFLEARDPGPFIRLLDFGVAKVVRSGVTMTGEVGTPAWLAPEQMDRSREVPLATDVWAFGLVAFYLLTGHRFWRGAGFDVLIELMADPYPSASQRATELGVADRLPPGFDLWFSSCVVRMIEARFPDMHSAWERLEPLLARPSARQEEPPSHVSSTTTTASLVASPGQVASRSDEVAALPVLSLAPPGTAPLPRDRAMRVAVRTLVVGVLACAVFLAIAWYVATPTTPAAESRRATADPKAPKSRRDQTRPRAPKPRDPREQLPSPSEKPPTTTSELLALPILKATDVEARLRREGFETKVTTKVVGEEAIRDTFLHIMFAERSDCEGSVVLYELGELVVFDNIAKGELGKYRVGRTLVSIDEGSFKSRTKEPRCTSANIRSIVLDVPPTFVR